MSKDKNNTEKDESKPAVVPPDLTVAQASVQLQCNEQIVRTALTKGFIKHYRVSPRNIRISQANLDLFKESGGMARIESSTVQHDNAL